MSRPLAAALVIVAVVLALLLLGRSSTTPPTDSESISDPPNAAEVPAPESGHPVGDLVIPDRPDAPIASEDTDPLGEIERTVTGIVVDSDELPIVGALIGLVHRPASGFHLLDREHRRESTTIGETTSDTRGEFQLPSPIGTPVELTASAPGYAPSTLSFRYAGERVVIVLERGAMLTGSARRELDGSPVTEAPVVVTPLRERGTPQTRSGSYTGRTDESGRYEIEGIPPGEFTVQIHPPRDASPRGAEVVLLAEEVTTLDWQIPAGLVVRGRVTDATTGEPIAGARISPGWGSSRFAETDHDGHYIYEGFDAYRFIRVQAVADGYAGRELQVNVGEHRGPITVDLELEPGRSVSGRVVDAEGEPVAGVYVAACASVHRGHPTGQHTDWRTTRTDESGDYEIGDLRTDLPHSLVVKAAGHGTLVYSFPDDESDRDHIEFPTVRLPAPATIRGTCVDETGAPILDQLVTLEGTNGDRYRFATAPTDRTWSIDGYIAKRSARTDHRGWFTFVDLSPGDYTVKAQLVGVHQGVEQAVSVTEGENLAGVELTLEFGLRITGRIATADGGAVPKTYLSVDPEAGGNSADVEADPEGNFVVEGLSEGRYSLTAYPYPTPDDRARGRLFSSRRVTGVVAGTDGLEIQLAPKLRVSGVVTDSRGEPVIDAYVTVFAIDGAEIAGATCDGEGRFSIELPGDLPGDIVVTIEARPPSRNDAEGNPIPPPPEARALRDGVRAGGETLQIVLPWQP